MPHIHAPSRTGAGSPRTSARDDLTEFEFQGLIIDVLAAIDGMLAPDGDEREPSE
jgi:hypothetical protein